MTYGLLRLRLCEGLPAGLGAARNTWLMVAALSIACLALISPASGAIAPPTGRVLLIIDGNLSNTNVGDELQLDMQALQALPQVSFRTQTPWTDDQWLEFRGVSLSALLEAAGAGSSTFTAAGFDDYAADVDAAELDAYPAMIAYEMNGKPMSLRQLGPLRILFPFSDHPELVTESIKTMAVWQLLRMTVH